ncbi:hypothetical protein R1sor_003363 [Riccia sorocarpa]|uniref:Uncharacterized protein n=1 Tax=Riccia sorocarpa TaxID=122646 RepID=A0ABD3H313_9MARC
MEEYEYLSGGGGEWSPGGEWSEGSAEGMASISSCCCQEKKSKIEFTRENIERSGGSCRPYKTGRDVCIVS